MRWLALLGVLAACGGPDAEDAPDAAACPVPGPGWTSAPDVGLGAVQETAAVTLGGQIYVLGGFDGSLAILDAVQVFDPVTCAWSRGPDLPTPMHHANAAVVDDTIYVLGYATGFDFAAHGEVYALEGDAWIEKTPMPAGTERSAAAVGVNDGEVLVVGGLRGGDAVTDTSRYDPATDAWVPLEPLPEPRDHGCGGVIGDTFYLAGGRLGDPDSHVATTYALDDNDWTSVAPMLTGRGGTACGVVGGRLIVVGGEGNPDDPTGVFPHVEAFDPVDDTWTALDDMPTPRHGMAAAVAGNHLHVPGGATQELFGAVATHEVLTF